MARQQAGKRLLLRLVPTKTPEPCACVKYRNEPLSVPT